MYRELDAADRVAELVMVRGVFKGTLLILEGPTDCAFFDPFLDSSCQSFFVGGKEAVIEVVVDGHQAGLGGVVGIVDADFWNVAASDAPPNDLLVTDHHDVEMLVVASPAFDRLMAELGSPQKCKTYLQSCSSGTIRDVLLEACVAVGVLRWISDEQGLNLKFEDLKVDTFLKPHRVEVDTKKLVAAVIRNTGFEPRPSEDLVDELEGRLGEVDLPLSVCCGDDFVGIWAKSLRSALGSCHHRVAHPDHLRKLLRLAFDSRDLAATKLYARSREWERSNPPFRVFVSAG